MFLSNLRSLLLTPPHRNSTVLAIDPGFSHGCKVAVLSPTGALLDTAVLRPNFRSPGVALASSPAGMRLSQLCLQHGVDTVAIGNGTACRETETLVAACIAGGLDGVQYTIVSEAGASIYSCSPGAGLELPGVETNILSAVSIGRRLQDPLSELVKIEPQHLGVGMYQHDLPQTRLNTALDEVVSECVSFVGVDINSCSEFLLRRVAGLNRSTARAILELREKQGGFVSREELRKVKGVGEKVWNNCVGFIRVNTSGGGNPLDSTQIHPESYRLAEKMISEAGLNILNLGKPHFCRKMKAYAESADLTSLARQFGCGETTARMTVESLQQEKFQDDLRSKHAAPLFKVGQTKVEEVKVGDVLSGRVSNVTQFGAFVDIGLGINGLVHNSKMRGKPEGVKKY